MVQLLSIGSGALVLAAVVVLAVIAFRTTDMQRRPSVRTLLLVYFVGIAPALAMSALWWTDALRVMIELHGIAFRSESGAVLRKDIRERSPGSSRLLIGDVPGRSRRIPETLLGTLVFRRAADGTANGALSIELPAPERRAGVIATTAHGLLGAQALENGDRICIGSECWTYSARGDSFTHGKQKFAIPPRQTKVPGLDWAIPLPFAKPITAGLRTYSIDFLARQGDASRSQDSLRSFIAYSQPGPRLRVLVLDANVSLQKSGPTGSQPVASQFEVPDGSRIHLYTLPSAGESFEANGITERRSAIYRSGARSFVLDFDTPEIHSLTERELKALHLESGDKDRRVALAMGDAQLIDRSLYFTGASESVALQSSSLIELPRSFPSKTSDIRILSPRGTTEATLDGVTWIGTADLAAVRMSVIRPPLLLLLAALLLQLLKVGCASASRFTMAQALLAGTLELLAGVRLIFGHRTWTMPPHRFEAAELGLLAWMMLPWVFIVASAPALSLRGVRRDGLRAFSQAWLPALAGLTVSAIFCARLVEGPKKFVWLGCHLLAIVVALLRAIEVREWFLQRWKKWTESDEVRPYLLCGAAFLIVRLLLLLFGFKESVMLPGGRISLSAIYIPAAAILQGAFLWRVWQRSSRTGRLQRADLIAALLLMTFIWLLPAGLTSDVGLALLNVPVFLLLLFAIDRRNQIVRVLIVLTVLFVAGAPLARVFLPFIASEETLLTLASDSNYARFLHFAAPEQLQQLATKRGESLAITSAILQRYISTGFFGVGYGHTDVSPHLGDTALRDFAPAVFIAAEWGLVGTLAMMLLYALIGYVAFRVTPLGATRTGMPTRNSSASMIAAVAGVTIAIASVYMILANHELVLLTGKNAYLFGLDSAGDVLETLGLVLVIAYGAAVARDSNDVLPGGFR